MGGTPIISPLKSSNVKQFLIYILNQLYLEKEIALGKEQSTLDSRLGS